METELDDDDGGDGGDHEVGRKFSIKRRWCPERMM